MATQQQEFPKLDSPLVDTQNGWVALPWYRFFISLWTRTGASQGGSSLSSGMMMDFGGPISAIPDGWFLCDGSAISRTTYDALFAVIGVTWGIGDGSSTFNLPNLLGQVSLGSSGAHPLGSNGGAENVTLDVTQLPSHSHGAVVTDPGHAHAQQVVNSGTAGTTGAQGASTANTTSVGTTDTTTTGITVANSNTGGGLPISLLPPFGAVLKIIKI